MDLFLCIAVGCETIENGNCHRRALVAYAPIIVSAFWFLVFTYLHHCILSHVPLSISMRSCSSLGSKRTLSMPFCGGCVVCLVLDVVSCLSSFSMYSFFLFLVHVLYCHLMAQYVSFCHILPSTLLSLPISHTPDTLQPGPPTPPPVPSTPGTSHSPGYHHTRHYLPHVISHPPRSSMLRRPHPGLSMQFALLRFLCTITYLYWDRFPLGLVDVGSGPAR